MYRNQNEMSSYQNVEVASINFEIEIGCKSIFVENWSDAVLFCQKRYDHTPPEVKPKDGSWISDDSYITIIPVDSESILMKYPDKNEINVYLHTSN